MDQGLHLVVDSTAKLKNTEQKVVCICGSTCRRDEKARHERTKKHLKYIANHEDTSDSDSDSDSDDE
jgi:hypothetical protein